MPQSGDMNPRLAFTLIAAVALLSLYASPSRAQTPQDSPDTLERGFATPPASARPHTWWHWINGNISKEGITADLEAMAHAGMGGAQIFNVDVGIPAGKTPFMSHEWFDAMAHAAREADRLGLELCFHNCAGWSSSGGPWITPERSMQMLTWSETTVVGGARFVGKLPQPETRAGFYRDICVLAVKRPPVGDTMRLPGIRPKAAFERAGDADPGEGAAPAGAVTPLSGVAVLSCAADGALTWGAPPGEWTLLRMGHTSTGETNHPAPASGLGLESDKLSQEATDLHWAKGIKPLLAALGPLAGKTLNNTLIDSYEVGSENWTPAFRAEFRKRRGYDPLPYLPIVTGRVIESAAVSERFLWDLRRTVADLYAANYIGRFRELAHRSGLKLSLEPYGNGMFDNLQIGAEADIPMGEFWVGGGAAETIKIAASAAHTAGRPIVGAESFTADVQNGRWLVEPYGIKPLGDRIFTLGVNRYIFHRYAHQPWLDLKPGMTMGPWGMHLERTQTWWETGAPAWLRYVARCQYLLQSGRFVADAVLFCGDGVPGDVPQRGALPDGYDYDGCDRTILMRMAVRNGALALPSGMRYRILVLPPSRWMTPETLRKIAGLVKAGATVVGPRPVRSPSLSGYPQCDAEVARLADEVWGDCDGAAVTEHRYGAGRIAWSNRQLPSLLATLIGTPDVTDPPGEALPWIHRRTNDADLYFVSNPHFRNQSVDVTFRVSGKVPELWHPETGVIEAAPTWQTERVRTRVTLRLGPAESVFVVFRRPARGDHLVRLAREGAPPPDAATPIITIEAARYEAVDGTGGADVTERVRALVAVGEIDVPATNDVFGDPTPNHVKRLHVRYTVGGKAAQKTAGENQTLSLGGPGADAALPEFEVSGGRLLAYAPGTYLAATAAGRERRFIAPPAEVMPVGGPWTLAFPPNLGAPSSATLDTLASWSENADPGIRYFSGAAAYETTFTVSPGAFSSGRALILDLGRVMNFAEVRLNGKSLPTLWKPPFRIDVTGQVHPGANTLTVRVTNLWPNRLIGDEQQPDEVTWNDDGSIRSWPSWLVEGRPRPPSGRVAFTTWRFWHKDDPLLESGLLGPVNLRALPTFDLSSGLSGAR
jgi:hypothetical protein